MWTIFQNKLGSRIERTELVFLAKKFNSKSLIWELIKTNTNRTVFQLCILHLYIWPYNVLHVLHYLPNISSQECLRQIHLSLHLTFIGSKTCSHSCKYIDILVTQKVQKLEYTAKTSGLCILHMSIDGPPPCIFHLSILARRK